MEVLIFIELIFDDISPLLVAGFLKYTEVNLLVCRE